MGGVWEEGAGGTSGQKCMAGLLLFAAYDHFSAFGAGPSLASWLLCPSTWYCPVSSQAGACLQQGLCRVLGSDPGKGAGGYSWKTCGHGGRKA